MLLLFIATKGWTVPHPAEPQLGLGSQSWLYTLHVPMEHEHLAVALKEMSAMPQFLSLMFLAATPLRGRPVCERGSLAIWQMSVRNGHVFPVEKAGRGQVKELILPRR